MQGVIKEEEIHVNKVYSLVWNHAMSCWKVAHEGARRHCKTGAKCSAIGALALLGAAPAFALPLGGTVVSGKADILGFESNSQMSINQHTDKLITNWTDFSIAAGQKVVFNQPSASSVALNRVIGTNVSSIKGQMDANGRVFLVNPNGIVVGQGAQINVGSLIATTKDIKDADFLAGKYTFSGVSNAEISNSGTINAQPGGSIALLGNQVRNDGVIQAQMGQIALGAGNDFTVNFDGNQLLNLQVNGDAINALAQNGGLLKADGGQVLMTGKSANAMLQTVVNNQGAIEAKTLSGKAGRITLDGGDAGTVKVGGSLQAHAQNTYGSGGMIEAKGATVETQLGTQVNTLATNGQTGTFKVSAKTVQIQPTAASAGKTAYSDTLSRNLTSTNIELASTDGDLNLAGPIAWNSANGLTLSATGNVNLDGNVAATGSGARVALNAGGDVNVNSKVSLTGLFSDLTLNHGGDSVLGTGGQLTLSGAGATYASNGDRYTVIQNLAQLQSINANLNGHYVLGNNIVGRAAQFKAIGDKSAFGGIFDGLGNTVSNLWISSTGSNSGLFAVSSGTISNLTLDSATINNGGSQAYGFAAIGGLVGLNVGTLSNVTARNLLVNAGSSGANSVGGVVGQNYGGTIKNAVSSGRVAGNAYTHAIGGIAGENVTTSGGTARVDHVVSNTVVGGAMQRDAMGGVGGLVGANQGGVITDAISTGSTNGNGAGVNVGGLVGFNSDGLLERTASSGEVRGTGAGNVGGLVGFSKNGDIIQSTSTSKVTGYGAIGTGGLVGTSQNSRLKEVKAGGDVWDSAGENVGGLVGNNISGTIDTAQALGTVTGGRNARVGGLVGNNYEGSITHSVARGKTSGSISSQVGGLVGANAGELQSVEASGAVVGGESSYVGGLVGTHGSNFRSHIESAMASGTVQGGVRAIVGGLVGLNQSSITNSSATGGVSGGSNATLGGLVGANGGNVRLSVATGKLTVLSPYYGQTFGGLVGANFGDMAFNGVSGEAALVPLYGINFGSIR